MGPLTFKVKVKTQKQSTLLVSPSHMGHGGCLCGWWLAGHVRVGRLCPRRKACQAAPALTAWLPAGTGLSPSFLCSAQSGGALSRGGRPSPGGPAPKLAWSLPLPDVGPPLPRALPSLALLSLPSPPLPCRRTACTSVASPLSPGPRSGQRACSEGDSGFLRRPVSEQDQGQSPRLARQRLCFSVSAGGRWTHRSSEPAQLCPASAVQAEAPGPEGDEVQVPRPFPRPSGAVGCPTSVWQSPPGFPLPRALS